MSSDNVIRIDSHKDFKPVFCGISAASRARAAQESMNQMFANIAEAMETSLVFNDVMEAQKESDREFYEGDTYWSGDDDR